MLECKHLGKISKGGRENSTCFCFISLQKHVWDHIRMKDFFVALPFSQHSSVLPHLFLVPHNAYALAELLVGSATVGKDAFQTQGAVLKASQIQ